MRNTETLFKDFYTWHFKDWFISGARSRLSVPGRGIYQDLLGLVYTEGGIPNDSAAMMLRLGIPPEYSRDMEAALKEFEVGEDGRLIHPRVVLEGERLTAQREAKRKGGQARAAKSNPAAPVKAAAPRTRAKPLTREEDKDEDLPY